MLKILTKPRCNPTRKPDFDYRRSWRCLDSYFFPRVKGAFGRSNSSEKSDDDSLQVDIATKIVTADGVEMSFAGHPSKKSDVVSLQVNPETYVVTADGVELTCEPAKSLPLTQRYFLF